jgi:hypothetical protein
MAKLEDIYKRQKNFHSPEWDDWSDHVSTDKSDMDEYVDQVHGAYHKEKMESWQRQYTEYLKTLTGHETLTHVSSVSNKDEK